MPWMYEHKTLVERVAWGINRYNPWAVEPLRQLVGKALPEPSAAGSVSGHDSSTNGLIHRFKRQAAWP
jgi:glucose-6-phosphate isomerase